MKKNLLLPVLFAVVLSASACGSKTSAPKTESTTAETTVAETTTVEETTTVPETEAAPQTIPMGEATKMGEWNITVNSMQIVENIPDGYGKFTPDAGNKYLLVSMSVSNEGKQANSFLQSFSMGDKTDAKIVYGDGYEFTKTNLLGYSKSLLDSSINPLSSKDGDIAYAIPDSVASATDPIVLEVSNGNEKLNFSIR